MDEMPLTHDLDRLRASLLSRAFLFEDPDAYRRGIEDTFLALLGSEHGTEGAATPDLL